MALMEGMKGCGGCHKIGIKTDDEINDMKRKGALKKPGSHRPARPVIWDLTTPSGRCIPPPNTVSAI
jgi:hypothetical protein